MKQNFFELGLEKKLKLLMAGRLILAMAMLGGGVLTSFNRLAFYQLIVAIYLLTLFYILGLKIGRAVIGQAYLQIVLDGIFLTGLIHWTGGIDSPFIFLYILPIVSAAVIITSRACIFIAIISALFYTLMVTLESLEIIRPFNPASYLDQGLVTYLLFLQVSMMVIISLLASYLSESLKRKGRELVELKSFTDEILNNIPDGVIAFDRLNRITYLNDFARHILKLPPGGEEIMGRSILDLWPVEDKREVISFSTLRRHPVVEGETNFYFAKDKKVPIGYVGSRLYYEDGRLKGGVIIFRDLSTLKAMEEAMKHKERFSAIGEMAAELAHEIRNPLAVLTGSLEILKEDLPISQESEALMELILKEAQGLNRIVSDFLRFSRPRELHLSSYNLRKLVEEALSLVKSHPHFSNRIKINFNHNNINPEIKLDPDEIRQAFFNLSLNAIEAMPNGGNLTIKIERDTKEKVVRIYFSDEGPGILPRDRDHLFEPFYTTKERGVGLGLAISGRIIKEHGGGISLNNNTDRGATFVVRLPI